MCSFSCWNAYAHVSIGRNSKCVFKSGQRQIRQKAITGVMSLKALFTVVEGLGSTSFFWASLKQTNERKSNTHRPGNAYRGIVTQCVCGFLVSNAVCKSSIMEDLLRRLIKPLIAFSDHLSSLVFGEIFRRYCNRFFNLWGLAENENGKLNRLLMCFLFCADSDKNNLLLLLRLRMKN